MKEVIFSTEAEREWQEAVAYYEKESPGRGRDFSEHVLAASEDISEFPKSGQILEEPIRKKVLLRYPYMLLYIQSPSFIQVFAVAHTSRSPDYWRDRLPDAALE